jgi:hypothetical protein
MKMSKEDPASEMDYRPSSGEDTTPTSEENTPTTEDTMLPYSIESNQQTVQAGLAGSHIPSIFHQTADGANDLPGANPEQYIQ